MCPFNTQDGRECQKTHHDRRCAARIMCTPFGVIAANMCLAGALPECRHWDLKGALVVLFSNSYSFSLNQTM